MATMLCDHYSMEKKALGLSVVLLGVHYDIYNYDIILNLLFQTRAWVLRDRQLSCCLYIHKSQSEIVAKLHPWYIVSFIHDHMPQVFFLS